MLAHNTIPPYYEMTSVWTVRYSSFGIILLPHIVVTTATTDKVMTLWSKVSETLEVLFFKKY